jgi:TetR/AcrR family transcriptional regulator, transcriptional repressor for nem operon
MTKGEATRQRIIEQAAPLFNQHGLAGSSIDDVLDATGLEKGGLYRHFASKQELAAECLKYSFSLMFQSRIGDADHIPHSIAKLRYLVDRFVSTPSPLKGGCPLMNAAVEADDGDVELRRLSLKALREWKDRLRQIIEDGMERGEVRRSVDPCAVANMMIAVLEGSVLISRLERSRRALDDAGSHLHSLIDGLVAA